MIDGASKITLKRRVGLVLFCCNDTIIGSVPICCKHSGVTLAGFPLLGLVKEFPLDMRNKTIGGRAKSNVRHD